MGYMVTPIPISIPIPIPTHHHLALGALAALAPLVQILDLLEALALGLALLAHPMGIALLAQGRPLVTGQCSSVFPLATAKVAGISNELVPPTQTGIVVGTKATRYPTGQFVGPTILAKGVALPGDYYWGLYYG